MDTYKHTQGEWEFSDMSYSNDYTVVHIGCGDELLAIMDGTNKKRVLADACLMAAAPELLNALQILLHVSGDDFAEDYEIEKAEKIAQAAINKATNQKYETNS